MDLALLNASSDDEDDLEIWRIISGEKIWLDGPSWPIVELRITLPRSENLIPRWNLKWIEFIVQTLSLIFAPIANSVQSLFRSLPAKMLSGAENPRLMGKKGQILSRNHYIPLVNFTFGKIKKNLSDNFNEELIQIWIVWSTDSRIIDRNQRKK